MPSVLPGWRRAPPSPRGAGRAPVPIHTPLEHGGWGFPLPQCSGDWLGHHILCQHGAAHVVALHAASLCLGPSALGDPLQASSFACIRQCQPNLSWPSTQTPSLCPCSAVCQHDPPGTLPHSLAHQRQFCGRCPTACLYPFGEQRGHGADQPHHGGIVLRPVAATTVSSRAISHPSASRQHPPAPRTTSASALAPLGLIYLLCCWPPSFTGHQRSFSLSSAGSESQLSPIVTRGSVSVLTLPSTASALVWKGGWQGDVAGMGERGWDGGMEQDSGTWAGQQDVSRTAGCREVGRSLKGGQARRKPGLGCCVWSFWGEHSAHPGAAAPILPSSRSLGTAWDLWHGQDLQPGCTGHREQLHPACAPPCMHLGGCPGQGQRSQPEPSRQKGVTGIPPAHIPCTVLPGPCCKKVSCCLPPKMHVGAVSAPCLTRSLMWWPWSEATKVQRLLGLGSP